MEKTVLNHKEVKTKQQKKISFVYIIVLLAVILVMFIFNNNLNKDYVLEIDDSLLKKQEVIKFKEEQGLALNGLKDDYENFNKMIEDLELTKLDLTIFSFLEDKYSYQDSNYIYFANKDYLRLTKQGKDVYEAFKEEGITSIEYFGETKYKLEYSSTSLTFKVNNEIFEFSIEDNNYLLKTDYLMDSYKINLEVYDKEWNFIKLEAKDTRNKVDYNGYFFSNLSNLLLSEDRLSILVNNENSVPSTDFLSDGLTVYYSTLEYKFSTESIKYVLLVNKTQEFPF